MGDRGSEALTVQRDIPPFASRRSAQCAWDSTRSRIARRSAASWGEIATCLLMSGLLFRIYMFRIYMMDGQWII